MKTSAKLKKYFKSLGINQVKVRTVKVKNPFVQVYLNSETEEKIPNFVRKAAVLCTYHVNCFDDLCILNENDINYGTTTPKSISLRVNQEQRFFELVESFSKNN